MDAFHGNNIRQKGSQGLPCVDYRYLMRDGISAYYRIARAGDGVRRRISCIISLQLLIMHSALPACSSFLSYLQFNAFVHPWNVCYRVHFP
jgi:hypothetical protein